MSSLALPQPARNHPRRAAVPRLLERLGPDALLVVAVLAFAVALLLEAPADFSVDSWLALVTGREVWQSGVPHHEILTALSYGHQWVDQQWLSQLVSYGIYLIGGVGLLSVVNVGLVVGGVGAAAAAARRLGASSLAVLVTLPVCVMLVSPSREVRTQTFVIPLFVAVCYLLARDSRAPSRRVFWCLPILVLWANLHGTVTLAAGLVALRGLTIAWERRGTLTRSVRAWLKPLALLVGAPISVLLTPYGLAMVDYYRTTMLGGTLRKAVIEWQPVTTQPVLAAFLFVLAGVALWSFGRNPGRTTLWERLSLIVLAVGAVSVQRNTLFLGLFGLMIVPVSIGLGRTPDRNARAIGPRRWLNGGLLAVMSTAAVVAGVVVLMRPAAVIEFHYQRMGVLTAVRQAERLHPGLRVFADERFDDWLLWRDPGLDGRLAADVRFELLSAAQLDHVEALLTVRGTSWKSMARGYRLLVLDRRYEPQTVAAFLGEPGRRVLYDDGRRLVILRSAAEAGRA